MEVDPYGHSKGTGWVLFAWIMMSIVGIMSIVYGITALANARFYAADAVYVFGTLNTWGWITLILGVIQLFVAASIWKGGEIGRWLGIVFAGLSAVLHMGSMQSYPFWTLVIIALDVMVVYGLAVYGGRREA